MAKRVLIIINTLNVGGAETFILKVFRSIDRSKLIFDFLVCEKNKGIYEDEVEFLGGRVYHGYYKVNNLAKNLYCIYSTVRRGKYKTVFIFSQHPIVALDLIIAKLGGANRRIVRSTNSACGGTLSNIVAYIMRPLMNLFISERIAPSREAALWLFGKRIVKRGKYTILNNGLDLNTFRFSESDRAQFRRELHLDNEIVIGHVGRFNYQKNHSFLIEVFKAFYDENKNSKLVLIGKGETKNQVALQVRNLGLNDAVIFLDVRSDIPYCLSGFDAFLFPSFFEGMPNTVVEAQACGLPCLISDSITKDAKITDLVVMKSLEETPLMWAKMLKRMIKSNRDRESYSSVMSGSGYSIDSVCEKLSSILL